MAERISNFEKVADGFYLCRDAKGFQDATRSFWGYTRQPQVSGEPKKYPCLVSFTYQSQGISMIVANSVLLKDLGKALDHFDFAHVKA